MRGEQRVTVQPLLPKLEKFPLGFPDCQTNLLLKTTNSHYHLD